MLHTLHNKLPKILWTPVNPWPLLLLLTVLVSLSCCGARPDALPPVSDASGESAAQAETQTDTESEDGGESESDADGDTETDAQSGDNGETDAQSVTDGGAKANGESESETQGGPDAQSGADGDTDTQSATDGDTESGDGTEYESEKHTLMPDPVSVVSEEAKDSPVFGSGVTRGQIASVTFLSDPSKAPDSAWDVSEAQDRSVLAWTLKAQPPFDLYISAENGVYAPADCSGMFCGYENLQSVRFDGLFDTSRAANMSAMFDSCRNLTELDVSGFDTDAVTDMESMFRYCSALESLDVTGFHTAAVTDMRSMFRNCSKLKALDISGFNMGRVKDVRWMFAECVALESLRLNSYDFAAAKLNDGYMKNVPMRFSATPLTGTPGFDDERNYTALFDGNPDTKWCLILNNTAYVEWKMANPGSVAHFSLTSADNHDKYPGRNPGSWRLLGTDRENRRDGVWTVLGEMNPAGFEEHDDRNYLKHTTSFSGEAPVFDYYRLEITSTTGAKILQLSEIDMDYR